MLPKTETSWTGVEAGAATSPSIATLLQMNMHRFQRNHPPKSSVQGTTVHHAQGIIIIRKMDNHGAHPLFLRAL
jgi:hypothetical protein